MPYEDLRSLGVQLKDTLKLRIQTNNRISHLAGRLEIVDVLRENVDQFTAQEAMLSKMLVEELKRAAHPRLLRWQLESKGIGEHLLARLLGEVGDPAIADPQWWEGTGENRTLMHGEPYARTPQQFFRYCGYGDPNDKRRKGMSVEEAEDLGRPLAKSILRLMAESCLKAKSRTTDKYTSPYRWVYDHYRVAYKTREGWTPKHQHNAALRKVARAIMFDLWLTSQGKEPLYGHGHNPGKLSGKAPNIPPESKTAAAPAYGDYDEKTKAALAARVWETKAPKEGTESKARAAPKDGAKSRKQTAPEPGAKSNMQTAPSKQAQSRTRTAPKQAAKSRTVAAPIETTKSRRQTAQKEGTRSMTGSAPVG
jgi:hypothetical protein